MTRRSITIPALVVAALVLAFMVLALRQINSGQQTRCTVQHACVDALDGPSVMRRLP